MAKRKDEFSNLILTEVTMPTLNVIEYEEIEIGLNLFDKVALVISRIEYIPASLAWQELDAGNKALWFGLIQSNAPALVSANERSVVDYKRLTVVEMGVVADGQVMVEPLVTDFSTLPGGGIIIAPKPLYIFACTSAYAVNFGAVVARIYFTIRTMADADYLELLESRRFFG
ncbi:hypothetical protein ES705_41885 [subsurface metagenome]